MEEGPSEPIRSHTTRAKAGRSADFVSFPMLQSYAWSHHSRDSENHHTTVPSRPSLVTPLRGQKLSSPFQQFNPCIIFECQFLWHGPKHTEEENAHFPYFVLQKKNRKGSMNNMEHQIWWMKNIKTDLNATVAQRRIAIKTRHPGYHNCLSRSIQNIHFNRCRWESYIGNDNIFNNKGSQCKTLATESQFRAQLSSTGLMAMQLRGKGTHM